MTRTFALGHATHEMCQVYDLVLQAQLAGIRAIAPGRTGHDTDKAARDIIDASAYAGTFGHGLGHSVGLVCHDGLRAAQNSRDVFSAGNIITMEPGIYLPGQFGVRIEDMVSIMMGPNSPKSLWLYAVTVQITLELLRHTTI